MVRQTKMGLSQPCATATRATGRCLGWISDLGRKLGTRPRSTTGSSQSSTSSSHALSVHEAAAGRRDPGRHGPGSAALGGDARHGRRHDRRAEEAASRSSHYGRNYDNTLSGIVWAIAGSPWSASCARRSASHPRTTSHTSTSRRRMTCSSSGVRSPGREQPIRAPPGLRRAAATCCWTSRCCHTESPTRAQRHLELWLVQVEGEIEGYRKAYRELTGVDLGAAGSPRSNRRPRPGDLNQEVCRVGQAHSRT